ncbi:hypothetical protein M413DRAFT_80614 [Hebeloma cylindrosporum]|uniref:Uncharacterized protein n=1 Tax=Hebeloma cylindrosporum TaxID=76867 RepID=A0A0C3CIH1_HEBCY|nr:hypothetical protein M413DRAFT_80614 [Hebeloma cylindrosporum h7]
MPQHLRCLSDSFAGKAVVDPPTSRFGPDRSPPTKRVRRLLHDPTRVQPMERVFSEYDWRTDKFAPTLRSVVPEAPSSASLPRRSKSAISHTRNFAESDDTHVFDASISRVDPSALRRVPDAARLSQSLLASEEMQGIAGTAYTPSPFYPTSPISRQESSSSSHWSPLQQFIASCETHEDEVMSSRNPKRRRDVMRTRAPGGSTQRRVPYGLDSSLASERTIVAGRSRANTWDSDITALDVSSLGKKGGKSAAELSPPLDIPIYPCAPSTDFIDDAGIDDVESGIGGPEDVAEMSDAARSASATQHALPHPPDLWTLWESEERNPASSSAGPSRTKRRQQRAALSPHSDPFTRQRTSEIEEIQRYPGFGFDAVPTMLDSEEDDYEVPMPDSSQKKTPSPIATFASAVRLRYVSLCLRIQLDAFRMEKKVKRKLKDPWMKSPPPPAGRARS